jgi:opacity protein-like surface antigen
MFMNRALVASIIILGIALGGTVDAKAPSNEDLYQIILSQQKAINRLEQMIQNMSHHGGEANNEHHNRMHPPKAPEPLVLKSKERMPATSAAPVTEDTKIEGPSSASPAQPADMPAKAGQPTRSRSGFYLMAKAEYSIPENIDVNNSVGQGEAILSDGVSLGLGLGYRFNRYIRSDVELARRAYELQNLARPSGANSRPLTGEAEIYSAMLSGYLDIPLSDLGADKAAGIIPYIGGGVGVGLLNANDVAVFNNGIKPAGVSGYSKTYSGSAVVPVAHLSAGLTIPVSDQVDIDLGYKYFLMGDLSGTRRGVKGESQLFRAHSALAGIRYNFR